MIVSIDVQAPEIQIAQQVEEISFKTLGLTEAKIEEFFRKNIGLIFDEEDEEETLLIVGQQVANLSGARNDLVALDGSGITKLRKAEHTAAEWQAAMEALILVATHGGPTMFARIGIMQALNRHVDRRNIRSRAQYLPHRIKIRERSSAYFIWKVWGYRTGRGW
jgi:hypothetical protein